MLRSEGPQQGNRTARIGAIGVIAAAAVTGATTLGAAAMTGQPPTNVIVNFWQSVSGGTSTPPTPPSGSAHATPGGFDPQTPDPSAVYHSGPLQLTYNVEHNSNDGVMVDLDAPDSDPQWGVVTLAKDSQYDFTWWSSDHQPGWSSGKREGLDFLNDAQGTVLDSADDSTCQAATGYTEHVLYKDLTAGRALCVATSEKRYTVLHITEVSADGNTLGFDPVKTFKKATDQ